MKTAFDIPVLRIFAQSLIAVAVPESEYDVYPSLARRLCKIAGRFEVIVIVGNTVSLGSVQRDGHLMHRFEIIKDNISSPIKQGTVRGNAHGKSLISRDFEHRIKRRMQKGLAHDVQIYKFCVSLELSADLGELVFAHLPIFAGRFLAKGAVKVAYIAYFNVNSFKHIFPLISTIKLYYKQPLKSSIGFLK
jgi:hypothetical protein